MARRIGARVYALPEDIVEVKPKMVMVSQLFSSSVVQATTRTTEDGRPELTRIPEKMATTKNFIQ